MTPCAISWPAPALSIRNGSYQTLFSCGRGRPTGDAGSRAAGACIASATIGGWCSPPPALGAAAEAAIDLASRCRRSLGGDRAHVVVAQYVARTDDLGPRVPTGLFVCNYRHSGRYWSPIPVPQFPPHRQSDPKTPIEVSIQRARSPGKTRLAFSMLRLPKAPELRCARRRLRRHGG